MKELLTIAGLFFSAVALTFSMDAAGAFLTAPTASFGRLVEIAKGQPAARATPPSLDDILSGRRGAAAADAGAMLTP